MRGCTYTALNEVARGLSENGIYILVNENGSILLNDMAINTKGSLDSIYRFGFTQSPYPDYWTTIAIILKLQTILMITKAFFEKEKVTVRE